MPDNMVPAVMGGVTWWGGANSSRSENVVCLLQRVLLANVSGKSKPRAASKLHYHPCIATEFRLAIALLSHIESLNN